MSKLGDAISWNRKKKEEYGLGSVGESKAKNHFSQGTGLTHDKQLDPPGRQSKVGETASMQTTFAGAADSGPPAPPVSTYAAGYQGASQLETPSYAPGLQIKQPSAPKQPQKENAKAAAQSGPSTPPASTYAASSQDTSQQPTVPYAAVAQESGYPKPDRQFQKNAETSLPGGPPLQSQSLYSLLPTPKGSNETEELRMETRQRTQLAKGVSPLELTWKELVGQARTYEPTVEDLTRRQELLEEELDRVKKRQLPPAVIQGALRGQKVTAKDLREQERYLENQLGQVKMQIRDKKLTDWYSIPSRPDYAEHSQAGESKRGEGLWSSGDALYDFINDIPRDGVGYRKLVGAASAGTGQSETYGGYTIYTYLTPEETGIYNYLYDTEGKEAADEFLEAIKEFLNYRMGKENFENMSEVGKGIYWLPQGVDQFTQGLLQRFSPDRKVLPTSPTQYTGGMIRQEIRDMGGIPSEVLGAAYDAGTAGSSALPGVLATWLLKAYHVPVPTAAAAGNGLTTTAMMGNAYKAKRDEGWSEDQAESYAKLMGAGAMASQQVLGAIGAFSGGGSLSDKAIQAVLPQISRVENGCVRFLLDAGARVGIRGTAGGSMAALQRLMDPLYTSVIRGEKYSVDLEDVTYAYLVGGMTSGLFEIPNALHTAQAQLGLSPYVFRIKGYMGKENVDYFSECTSLEEVQTQYRGLVEQYHPDMGGDAGLLATINAQYDLQKGYYRGKAAGEAALALQSPEGPKKSPEGETAGLTLGKDLVSDTTAGELLRNPSMVSFLRKYGDLKLEKGMTEEQKRLAIRQAVERAVHKEKPAVNGGGTLDTGKGGSYDGIGKTTLGGLTDGREETGLDGREKASDSQNGGEILWREAGTGHAGRRSTAEQSPAFVERAKAEGKIVRKSGREYYAYSITPQENYAPETREAVKAAAEWGLASSVVDSFERNNGEKTFTGMVAITGPEGQVFLVNGCDSEAVAHEGLHSGLRRDIPEAKRFVEAVCEVDIMSEEMRYALEEISKAYYDETGREFDLGHLEEETAAFISGMIETGQLEKFFGLTEEGSPELFASWREFKAAMGANPMQPNQGGSESTDEFSYLQKNTLKPTGNGLVSDEMADKLLGDQSSVGFLTRKGGLKLSKKMSQQQRRAAVRQAVGRIIERKKESALPKGDSIKTDGNSFMIGIGVGAKAKNYDVMDLENGEIYHFVEGSRVQNVKVFAGKGTKVQLRIAGKYAAVYGGLKENWQHVKGFGILETPDGDRKVEVHWMQCEDVGKFDFFIKRWLD